MTQLTKDVQCPFCSKIFNVYWGSFRGVGKQCPNCNKTVTYENVKVIFG